MKRILVSLVVVGSAVLACSSSDDSPADDGFESFINSYCTVLVGCCIPTGQRTVEACAAILRAQKPDLAFDKAKGDACVAELRSREIDQVCANVRGVAPSCVPALASKSGPHAPGEACTKVADCTAHPEGVVTCVPQGAGSICELTIVGKENDGPCVGTLEAQRLVEGVNASRPPSGYTCDSSAGLYCNRTTTKCTKIADVGGDCEVGTIRSCVRAAYCAPSKKCEPRVAIGAACDNAECVRDAKCGDDKKCFALKSTSALCMQASECATGYCLDGRCGTMDPPGEPILTAVCETEAK